MTINSPILANSECIIKLPMQQGRQYQVLILIGKINNRAIVIDNEF